MNRKTLVILILTALTASLGCLALIILFVLPPESSPPLSDRLSRVDNYIALSYRTEAEQEIDRAARMASSAEEWLQVLKRFALLAKTSRNYGPFKQAAVRAFNHHPEHPALCRVALFACLRDGDPGMAMGLRHGFQTLPAIQSLQAEILLVTQTPSQDPALATIPLYQHYLVSDGEHNPERFMTAARELNDERYFLDAALLYMGQGKVTAAYDTACQFLLRPQFDEPAGLIAYEQGDFPLAARRLSAAAERGTGRPDLFIIAGDCLLIQEIVGDAEKMYHRALQTKADFSVVPYRRLARLQQQRGATYQAEQILARAVTLYPQTKTVVADYAVLTYEQGHPSKARQALDIYLGTHPDDIDIRLLRMKFDRDKPSAERMLATLRHSYFEHPGNTHLAKALINSLLANRDPQGARTILLHFLEVNGDLKAPWLLSVRGVLESLQGNPEQAAVLFYQASMMDDRYEYHYNRAIACQAAEKTHEAEKELQRTLVLLETQPHPDRIKAFVHAHLADLYWQQGYNERARSALDKALDIDPENAAAFRLLRRMEKHER